MVSSDLMTYSYVFQRAYVVAAEPPGFRALCADDPELARALRSPALRARIDERVNGNGHPSSSAERRLAAVGEYLAGWLDPEPGFVTAHFSPAGGRMFFSEGNAARIDAARAALERWRTAPELIARGWFGIRPGFEARPGCSTALRAAAGAHRNMWRVRWSTCWGPRAHGTSS